MTLRPITLIPKTPRMQARIIRFCSMLQELADGMGNDDEPFETLPLEHHKARFKHESVNAQSKIGFTLFTSHPFEKKGQPDELRSFNSIEIAHPSGTMTYEHTDDDSSLICASPAAMIKALARTIRPLPNRAFAILNDEFHGSGDWNTEHPLLPLLNTAYISHGHFQTVMGFDTRKPAIAGLYLPSRTRDDWFFHKNPNHRGMTVHTKLKNPIATPRLHPEVISQIGHYHIIQTPHSASENSLAVTPTLTNRRFSEVSTMDCMHHIRMLQSIADSISPPPPTPIRLIARR